MQRIVYVYQFIMVFYLQQIWLDQNITQKLASAYKANQYFTVFTSKPYCRQNEFLSFPQQFHTSTAKFRNRF
jgi:hypothetical protein